MLPQKIALLLGHKVNNKGRVSATAGHYPLPPASKTRLTGAAKYYTPQSLIRPQPGRPKLESDTKVSLKIIIYTKQYF